MVNAFNYMFRDNKYAQKALTLGFIIFLSQLCLNTAYLYKNCGLNIPPSAEYYILNILGSLINTFAVGYGFTCIKALCEQKDNYVLPFINLKHSFLLGLKNCIAVFLFTTILALITFIPLIAGFIFRQSPLIPLVLMSIILIGSLIYIISYTLAYTWIFAKTDSMLSYVKIKLATQLIKSNKGSYWKAVGWFALITIAFVILVIIAAGILGIFIKDKVLCGVIMSLLAATISAYISFVGFFITAKAINPETVENI